MSVFNPTYNPVGYPTDAYGRPLLENSYAPFYLGPFADQYVPRHWTPDPNQAFYAPSISQGIPPGWHHPPAFHADGNNPRINPGGYSAAPPNPAYLPPAHYYAYPISAAAPVPPEATDNYFPPPPTQRIKAYAQQCDKVLHFLCLSPAEFARCTRTLLTNLGYPDASTTPEVWADQLLDFHKRYLQGNLPENTQGTLGIDDNLRNKLRALVEEIHTSPNPHPFEDPLDPTRSFHMQCEEPVRTQNEAPPSIPHQQEELNVASSILRNLNPVGGLFDQPAAHTLALSARPWANSVPSAFQTWEAYAQQCDKVLCFLHLSPMEFARHTCTLLTNLGYPNTSATPEVWVDRLLDFHKRYLQGNLLETTQGTLGIDDNLQNELRALVEEIHTSPNPCPFKDPLDPACSFHVQCKEPIKTQSQAPLSIPHQQEELNVASSILRNLNPIGGLFDQPAAHTLALSARSWANSVPSAFQTWDQPTISEPRSHQPLPCVDNDNWTLSYIDEPGNSADEHAPCNGPPQDQPPHFDLHAPCVNAPLPHPNALVPL
ncbi:hypothetical protein C0989_006638 [Termitomyces sp. Mn162]|nr:hypothetical protein C0989_006638 [Termitomyces sp. Mn162]